MLQIHPDLNFCGFAGLVKAIRICRILVDFHSLDFVFPLRFKVLVSVMCWIYPGIEDLQWICVS